MVGAWRFLVGSPVGIHAGDLGAFVRRGACHGGDPRSNSQERKANRRGRNDEPEGPTGEGGRFVNGEPAGS